MYDDTNPSTHSQIQYKKTKSILINCKRRKKSRSRNIKR